MMKKWGLALLAIGLVFTSCKSDDDNDDLPQDEQNQIDDTAIVEYLEEHYFDPARGLIKKYDEVVTADSIPNLKSLGTKLPSGVWIIPRAGVPAEGEIADDNLKDSILISYNSMRFKATYEDLGEGEEPYSKYQGSFYNTIYSSGTAAYDPIFYYTKITDAMAEKNIDLTYFTIEGFLEGLKHFKSTQTNGSDLYNFQGAIVVPSRLAYGRDFVFLNGMLDQNTYRDNSFVFNFELHKVLPRNTEE